MHGIWSVSNYFCGSRRMGEKEDVNNICVLSQDKKYSIITRFVRSLGIEKNSPDVKYYFRELPWAKIWEH